MSQDQLARASQLGQSVVSRVERGLYPATLALIERLFGALDLELRVQTGKAHADLDEEIAVLARLSITQRLEDSLPMIALTTLNLWGPPFVIEGALAAVLQGAPIPVDEADVAVSRRDQDAIERWLSRTGVRPWSDERQEFTFDSPDLRRCRTVRWLTGHGVLRTRFADALPAHIKVTHGDTTYLVRPLAEVEVVDDHAAEMLARWRELAGSGQVGEALRPVAAVANQLDQA